MTSGTFHRADLESLLQTQPSPHLTITLSTHRFGREAPQGAKTLERLIGEARRRLATAGVDEADGQRLLAPIASLVDDADFWQHQDRGLVVFARSGTACWYRLPQPVAEAVALGPRFIVRPLLPLFSEPERFFVIALSINAVRVVEATVEGIRRVDLPGLPAGMDQALGYEQYYSEIDAHVGGPAAMGRRRRIVHGHGDADEERLERNLLTYFRRVADALRAALPARVPWVLAAVGRYFPIFRAAVHDDERLLASGLVGNPDASSDLELVHGARPLLSAVDRAERMRALDRLEEEAGTARTTTELQAIVAAAHQGRVDSLFVGSGAPRFGTFEPDLARTQVHGAAEPGDEDLVDSAIFHTLRAGGHVFALGDGKLPMGRDLAALLRY